MPIYTPPIIKEKLSSIIITDPNVAANVDIDLAAYQAKLDLDHPYPLIEADLIDWDQVAKTFVHTQYTIATYGTAGALAAGEHCIVDEDTIQLGEATDTGAHNFILILTGMFNRILNT